MLCVRSLIVSAWLGLRAPGGVTRVQLEDSPMRARNESGEVLRRTECEGPPAAVLRKVGGPEKIKHANPKSRQPAGGEFTLRVASDGGPRRAEHPPA